MSIIKNKILSLALAGLTVLSLNFVPTALLVSGGSAVVLSGCVAGKGTYDPKTGVYDKDKDADKVIVAAQKTRDIALDVMDTYLKLERENEKKLKDISPVFHQIAEAVRANGKKSLTELSKAIKAYQSERTESNKVNVQQALAVVQSILASVQSQFTAVQKIN